MFSWWRFYFPRQNKKNASSDFDAIFSLKFHVVTRWNNGNLIWYLTNFFCRFISKPIADRMRLSIVWAALFHWWKNRKLIIQVFCVMTSLCYISGVLRQRMKNTLRIEENAIFLKSALLLNYGLETKIPVRQHWVYLIWVIEKKKNGFVLLGFYFAVWSKQFNLSYAVTK